MARQLRGKNYRDYPITWSDVERFAALYEISDNGCWHWHGATNKGYGQFWIRGFTSQAAHRFAFFLATREIPRCLDHLCRNTACVNPKHLESVDIWTNTQRGTSPVAHNSKKTHCAHGHEFTPENTGYRRGWRECKTCKDLRKAKANAD